ncbi:MAG: porin family protein [Sulfurovum sp.]|nr:porin family protein [Sulfurovum sp.]
MKKLIFSVFLMNSVLFAGGGVVPTQIPVQTMDIVNPSPYYVGLGFVRGHYDGCIYTGCKYVDVTFGTMARVGYEWNQYLGIEARVLGTFWGADPLGGQELAYGGLFARPMYGFAEDFNIYGLLGYGWTKTRTGGNGNLQTVDEGGFSAGLGMEYDFSSKEEDKETNVDYTRTFDGQANQENGWGVFVDYQRLLIKSSTPKVDVISIGFTYDF